MITSPSVRPWATSLLAAPRTRPELLAQLSDDLASFPEPWLDFMQTQGVRVAVLEPGQSLLDSPVIARKAVLQDELPPLRQAIGEFLEGLPEGFESRMAVTRQLHEALQASGSSLRVLTHRGPFTLQALADQRNIEPGHRPAWEKAFLEFNQDWLRPEPEGVGWTTRNGVCLLPPVPTPWGALSDRDYQDAAHTRAEDVAESLGLNRGSDRLVLLHPHYLSECAPEIGHYRVAVHELGHALDYVLEGLPDSTGFGSAHREQVRQLFHQARAEGSFLTDRADDSPREYFAEAVEAYLTQPSTGPDFRPDNHRQQLQQRDPAMFRYLQNTLEALPSHSWVSTPPPPVGVPEGFPDPDRDPIYWDN